MKILNSKVLFQIVFLIMLVFGLYGQSDSISEIGQQYYQNQEYGKALEIWEDCIKKDTLNKYCVEQAGQSAMRLGILPKARDYFHKLENDSSYYKAACINLANIYEIQGVIPKAIKYNRRLRDSFPENPTYYKKLGSLFSKAGFTSEAFTNYAQALKLNPQDLITIQAISEIFIANEQFEDADSLIRVGLDLDSTNITMSLLHARNFYSMKLYDSTVVVLDGIRGRIDFTNYHNRMFGYALLQIDSTDRAIWYLERSLVDESNPEFAHYYLANAYEIKENPEVASYHYNKAIESGASNGLHTYHRNLARIQKNEGQLKESIENYKWAYKYRDDPLILLYLGQAADDYYKDKNIAVNYYNQYIRSDHENQSYKKFAKERVQLLKAYMHQSK